MYYLAWISHGHFNPGEKKKHVGECSTCFGCETKTGVVPSVNYVLRAPIFLNSRNFGTKRDTTKKLKSNS